MAFIGSPSPFEPPRPRPPPSRVRVPQPIITPRPQPAPPQQSLIEKVIATSNTVSTITEKSSSLSKEYPTGYKYQLLYLERGNVKKNLNFVEPKDSSLRSKDTIYFLIENDPKYPKINLNKGFIAYFKTGRGKVNRFHVSNISFV